MAVAMANDEGEFDGWFCCCVLLVSLGHAGEVMATSRCVKFTRLDVA